MPWRDPAQDVDTGRAAGAPGDEWELADSLMTGIAQTLMATSSPDVRQRALRLFTGPASGGVASGLESALQPPMLAAPPELDVQLPAAHGSLPLTGLPDQPQHAAGGPHVSCQGLRQPGAAADAAVKLELFQPPSSALCGGWAVPVDSKLPPLGATSEAQLSGHDSGPASGRVLRPRRGGLHASLIAEELAGDCEEETLAEGQISGQEQAGQPSRRPARKPRRRGTKGRKASARAALGQSSSQYRGVSRHRLTQRWEASLWLSGKQLYLGGFEVEADAARAYDIAALASKGLEVPTNFPASSYAAELVQLRDATKEEIVAYVRRRSSAFARGRSPFRGVSGEDGRWEARIGSFQGRKNVSFGVFETEEGAARQYDRALIIEKGRTAKTNFPLADYEAEVVRFKALLADRFAGLSPPALAAAASAVQLPLEPPPGAAPAAIAAQERARGGRPRGGSAVPIFAESLRKALAP